MELSIKELRQALREEYQIELVPAAELERLLNLELASESKIFPIEFTERDKEIYNYVKSNKLTMVPHEGLINTILSANYVVKNGIVGDFVECGVWRGGNALAALMVFEALGSEKLVWLYDTFQGMTEPSDDDFQLQSQELASVQFSKFQRDDHNAWCYASIEDVRKNISDSGVNISHAKLIQGDVMETLRDEENVPTSICALRLDTDWYESTKEEMARLYPLVSKKGILIIDDYGYWNGSRKAIDEFFHETDYERPFLQVVYINGTRCGIKPG